MNDNKCDRQISGLLYLDKTDIGTEFDEYVISPTMYKWYLWDSNLRHRVIPKVSKNKRYTIATSIGINEKN